MRLDVVIVRNDRSESGLLIERYWGGVVHGLLVIICATMISEHGKKESLIIPSPLDVTDKHSDC